MPESHIPNYLVGIVAALLLKLELITQDRMRTAIAETVMTKVNAATWSWWRNHFGKIPRAEPSRIEFWADYFRELENGNFGEDDILTRMRALTAAYIENRILTSKQYEKSRPVAQIHSASNRDWS